jgi:diacylglycerol kinase
MKNKSLLTAFKYAFNGLIIFIKEERNGKIQFTVAGITIIAAALFHLSAFEWIIILLCITAVISLEMVNSCIEKLCDLYSSAYHPLIKIIKDIAAGAVLVTAVISVVIGVIIFLPKIIIIYETLH